VLQQFIMTHARDAISTNHVHDSAIVLKSARAADR